MKQSCRSRDKMWQHACTFWFIHESLKAGRDCLRTWIESQACLSLWRILISDPHKTHSSCLHGLLLSRNLLSIQNLLFFFFISWIIEIDLEYVLWDKFTFYHELLDFFTYRRKCCHSKSHNIQVHDNFHIRKA